jgi:hypothetical protein
MGLHGFFPKGDVSRVSKDEVQVSLNESGLGDIKRLRSVSQFKVALQPIAKIAALHFTLPGHGHAT